MCRSFSVSMSWLKVLAEQAASIVPTETAVKGTQATGPPAARKPAEVVRTTRALGEGGRGGRGKWERWKWKKDREEGER